MKLNKEYSDGILKISGSLDIDSADIIRETLRNCLEPQAGNVTFKRLDLGEVESCDLCALQLLLAAQKDSLSLGNPLPFDPVSPAIVDLAAALGLSIGAPHAS